MMDLVMSTNPMQIIHLYTRTSADFHDHGPKILARGINVQTTNQQVNGNGPKWAHPFEFSRSIVLDTC